MNKTIFITGAAKRIGKSIALTFKDLGWNIIIHYNSSKKDAEDLANEINKDNPDTAQIVQGNLDKEEDIQKILNGSMFGTKVLILIVIIFLPVELMLMRYKQILTRGC